MKTITIISTKNTKIAKIKSNVANNSLIFSVAEEDDIVLNNTLFPTTWGELKTLLIDQEYDVYNLKATENINKTTLEYDGSILPTGDFRIFLRPEKPKSGLDVEGLDFKQLRQIVNNENLKNYLNNYSDKNWTQMSLNELSKALSEYNFEVETKKVLSYEEQKELFEASVNNLKNLYEGATNEYVKADLSLIFDLFSVLKDNLLIDDEYFTNQFPEIIETEIERKERLEIEAEMAEFGM